jgi:hypothetical protein
LIGLSSLPLIAALTTLDMRTRCRDARIVEETHAIFGSDVGHQPSVSEGAQAALAATHFARGLPKLPEIALRFHWHRRPRRLLLP